MSSCWTGEAFVVAVQGQSQGKSDIDAIEDSGEGPDRVDDVMATERVVSERSQSFQPCLRWPHARHRTQLGAAAPDSRSHSWLVPIQVPEPPRCYRP